MRNVSPVASEIHHARRCFSCSSFLQSATAIRERPRPSRPTLLSMVATSSPVPTDSIVAQELSANRRATSWRASTINDAASPARVLDTKDDGAQYVLMPLRV